MARKLQHQETADFVSTELQAINRFIAGNKPVGNFAA